MNMTFVNGRIKAEVEKMKQFPANIQAQIDEIVLEGTSGDSSAEVAQARVDNAGNTFSTVNARLIKTEQSIESFIDKKNTWDWVFGYIDANTHAVVATGNTRIVTNNIVLADKDLVISTDFDTYNIAVQKYSSNSNASWLSDSGWVSTTQTIPAGTYFRILVRYTNNAVITDMFGDIFNTLTVRFFGDLKVIGENQTAIASITEKTNLINYDLLSYTESLSTSRGVGALTNGNALFFSTIIENVTATAGEAFGYDWSVISDNNDEIVSIIRIGFKDSSGTVLVRNDISVTGYGYVLAPTNAASMYLTVGYYAKVYPNTAAYNAEWRNIYLYRGFVQLHDKVTIPNLENNLFHNISSMARYVAHRGSSDISPENTTAAFTLAGESNYFWGIETDIYDTSDGYLVCHHDTTLDRMTNGTGAVGSLTYAQIRALQIDAGNNIGNYPGLQIPSFEEYLKICRKYGKVPLIEMQTFVKSTSISKLVETIKKYGFEYTCIILSFSLTQLTIVRALSRNIHLSYNITAPTTVDIDNMKNLGNCGISAQTLTDALVQYAHAYGLSVFHWVRDSESDKNASIDLCVDGITTNKAV